MESGRRVRKVEAKGTLCAAVRSVGMQAEAHPLDSARFPADFGWSSFSRDLGVEITQLRTEWVVRKHRHRMGQL